MVVKGIRKIHQGNFNLRDNGCRTSIVFGLYASADCPWLLMSTKAVARTTDASLHSDELFKESDLLFQSFNFKVFLYSMSLVQYKSPPHKVLWMNSFCLPHGRTGSTYSASCSGCSCWDKQPLFNILEHAGAVFKPFQTVLKLGWVDDFMISKM